MLKQYISNTKISQQITTLLVIVVVAVIGTILLTGSHAESPYVSSTADNGTAANGAVKQTCTGASDGNCVVFGSSSGSSGSSVTGGGSVGSGTASCTSTLNPSDGVDSSNTTTGVDSQGSSILDTTIASASSGAVICLNTGSYPSFFIRNSIARTSYVTIQAAPGAKPVLAHQSRVANGSYLRFQGLAITAELDISDGATGPASHNIEFLNNDISGSSGPRIVGYGGNSINNLTFQGNYIHDIDAVGACASGGSASTSGQGITLADADNVLIQDNALKSIGWHFIQGGGGTIGVTVQNNLFTGPQPVDDQPCAHINVWQIFAGGNNDTFSNNVIVGSTTQNTTPVSSNALMFENGAAGSVCTTTMTNTAVSNNLFADENGSFEFQLMTTTNLSVTNNTVVGSAYGTLTARSDICGKSTNVTETNNIVTDNTNGSFNLGFGGCVASASAATKTFPAQCLTDYNVSQDKSAGTLPGTSHYVASWTPKWSTTAWSPTCSITLPQAVICSAIPPGYYQPATGSDIPFSVGYQGSIGP